jgi:hypothetical protein
LGLDTGQMSPRPAQAGVEAPLAGKPVDGARVSGNRARFGREASNGVAASEMAIGFARLSAPKSPVTKWGACVRRTCPVGHTGFPGTLEEETPINQNDVHASSSQAGVG